MKTIFFLTAFVLCDGENYRKSPLLSVDNDLNIERPCRNFDVYCIQRYLADHSDCKISNRPVPEQLYRRQSSTNFPRANLTVIIPAARYSGLNGRIEEFYVNKVTDNLLLAVNFRNVLVYGSNAYFIYYRPAREPIITTDFAQLVTRDVTTTIIIPNLKNLQPQKGEVYPFINSPLTEFSVGPRNAINPDLQVPTTIVDIAANVPGDYQEGQLTESPFTILTYIQYTLCDFGLDT